MDNYMLLDIYLRLSELRYEDLNKDGQSHSMLFEEKRCRERILQLGGRVGEVIIENDIVDGKPKPASAFKRKKVVMPDGTVRRMVVRPGFRRLLDRMKRGLSGGFMTVDLDRAVRDPRDLEDLFEIVEEVKANVRTLSNSLTLTDGGNSSEQDMASLLTTMARRSSRETSRRVTAARQRKAEAGEFGGGKRRFGFELDGITVRESEAAEVLKMTRSLLANATIRSIVSDLRQRNIPTVDGAQWSGTVVKAIIRRPRNAGILVHRGEELPSPAPWEPIVPVDEFRAAVAKLENQRNAHGRTPRWLGSGIYRCCCGEFLYGHALLKQKPKSSRIPRYRCKESSGNVSSGEHTARRIAELDEYVTDLVFDWCAQPAAQARLFPVETEEIDVVSLRAEAKALEEEMNGLAYDKLKRKITPSQFAIFNAAAMERLHEIESLLAKARENTPTQDLVLAASEALSFDDRRRLVMAKWEKFTLEMRRLVLSELVNVTLLPVPPRYPFDPEFVEVEWKY